MILNILAAVERGRLYPCMVLLQMLQFNERKRKAACLWNNEKAAELFSPNFRKRALLLKIER